MLPIIQIGPLALQTPGLILLLGVWVGLMLSDRQSRIYQLPSRSLENLVLTAILGGLVGARLAYVIRYPTIFIDSPLSLVSPNPGLLDVWVGLLTGCIMAIIYIQRKKLPFWNVLDGLAPVLGVISLAIHLSNLASGSGYGSPTSLPWGIDLWGTRRHPTQVYEALAALIILLVTWFGTGKEPYQKAGLRFLAFCILSSFARVFLEAYRGDSTILLGSIRAAQLIAWMILASSLWLYSSRLRSVLKTGESLHDG